MEEEKLKFVGTYITEELYFKLRMKCAKKCTNISKSLVALIMVYTKDVNLDIPVIAPKEENAETNLDR